MYSVYIYVHIPENLKTSVFRIYTSPQQTNDGQKRISRLVSLGRAKAKHTPLLLTRRLAAQKRGSRESGDTCRSHSFPKWRRPCCRLEIGKSTDLCCCYLALFIIIYLPFRSLSILGLRLCPRLHKGIRLASKMIAKLDLWRSLEFFGLSFATQGVTPETQVHVSFVLPKTRGEKQTQSHITFTAFHSFYFSII